MNETDVISGAEILDDAAAFAKTVLFAGEEQIDALVLACAVSHTIASFTTLPRLLATAPEKESGKSTLLNLVAMLGNNPWDPDPTSFALRSKFNEREAPTVIIDEISDIYGRSGLRSGSKDLNTILKKGYQKNAKLSLSVDRVATEVSCFCVAAMAGLRTAVPDDVWSRCIVFKMKPVPYGIRLRDSLDESAALIGRNRGERIHQWARQNQEQIRLAFRDMRSPHRKMRSRLRQIWFPLYAVALAAGADWPARCLRAFEAMALDASDQPVLTEIQMILRDAAECFTTSGADRMFARDIKDYLRGKTEVEIYESLPDRVLGQLMTEALGARQAMTLGTGRAEGYHARTVLAAWKRLEAQLAREDEAEDELDEFDTMFDVMEVTQVSDNKPPQSKGRSNGRAANSTEARFLKENAI
jgi:hypothetical protein